MPTRGRSFAAVCAFLCTSALSLFAQQEPAPIPGRLLLQLERSAWQERFTRDPKGNGLERLRSCSAAAKLLATLGVVRLWRPYGMVEETVSATEVQVVAYEKWEKKWNAQRERRPNERPYAPLSLPSATSVFEVQLKGDVSDSILQKLRQTAGVIAAERALRASLAFTPNDPGWLPPGDPAHDAELARGRWGLHNTGAALGPDYLDDFDIDAPEAWDVQRGNPSLVVAVSDSEIDVTHADLHLNVFLNGSEVPPAIVSSFRGASADDGLPAELTFYDLNVPSVVTALGGLGFRDTNANGRIDGEDAVAWWSNGIDTDGNGYVDDLVGWNFEANNNRPFGATGRCTDGVGHGTCSAGLIAAVANNGRDVAGVAHRVRFLPITASRALADFAYAVSFSPVRVINSSMSYGITMATQAEINAFFRSLDARGVTFVASLGNIDGLYYGSDPAQREQVIAVTNFMHAGRRAPAPFSGAGPKTDVAAPAEGVSSTRPGGGTTFFGGTSGASPITAGVAALVMSQRPELSPEQVRQFLRMTAVNPAPVADDGGENTPGWDPYSGWGLVNARRALDDAVARIDYAEANIISRVKNFSDDTGSELLDLSIGTGMVPIRAMIGLPRSPATMVDWTLRRSPNWDLSGAVVVATGRVAYSEDVLLATIDSDALDGRQVLELEVRTAAGAVSRDRAVLDLPRAYLARELEGARLSGTASIKGMAYGPGFTRFRLLVAPGWSAASGFREVASFTTAVSVTPSSEPGEVRSLRALRPFGPIDLEALPITVPATGEVTLRLIVDGIRSWTADTNIVVLTAHPPFHAGFPREGYFTAAGSPTAVDLDGDGQKEIIVTGTTFLHVIRTDGSNYPGFPVSVPEETPLVTAAAGDVNGDGRAEIVLRTRASAFADGTNYIRVVRADGTMAPGAWPARIDNPSTALETRLPPVLADIDGDGRLDILASVPRSSTAATPLVRAWSHDGTVIREFATTAEFETLGPVAVGDLDGDGAPEILAAARRPVGVTLYAWRAAGGMAWTREINSREGPLVSGPLLMDVNGDGRLDVVVATEGAHISVIPPDGGAEQQFDPTDRDTLLSVGQLRPGAAPAETSIVAAGQNFRPPFRTFIRVLDASSMTERAGWAGGAECCIHDPIAQPVIADLHGGAEMEIAYAHAPGFRTDQTLRLRLWNAAGTQIDDAQWPIEFPDGGVESTPLVTDIDGDGRLNLVVSVTRPDSRIYMFDLATTAHPGAVAWGEHAHDPRRSANYHGDLRILSPSTATAQTVGPFDDARQQSSLLVRVEFARGTPGGDSNSTARWRVAVGGVAASVRRVTRIGGEHWLLVDPVVQPAAGARLLRVEFDDGGIRTWHTYRDAVIYEAAARRHTVIPVIDRSASMRDFDKLEGALAAGGFFAASAYDGDEVGVVSFNETATDVLPGLRRAGDHRDAIDRAISGITASGDTSIGGGMNVGLDLLEFLASRSARWGMIVLSDGLENRSPFWSRGTAPVSRRVSALRADHPDLKIHTVALGPDADHSLLADIAAAGGGDFYPVALGHSVSMLNRLADAYHFAREEIDATARLGGFARSINKATAHTAVVDVPFDARRLQFAFNWDRGAPSLELVRPDGRVVRASDPLVTVALGRNSAVFTIAAPEGGAWRATARYGGNGETEVLLAVSAAIPYRLHLWWILDRIYAVLTGPIGMPLEISFSTIVTRPDKKTFELALQPVDLKSGIYSALVPFELKGGYLLTMTAKVGGEQKPVATITRQVGKVPPVSDVTTAARGSAYRERD